MTVDWKSCAPSGGWQANTYYVVNAAFGPYKTERKGILYIDNITDNIDGLPEPSGVSCFFMPQMSRKARATDEGVSLRVVSKIPPMYFQE